MNIRKLFQEIDLYINEEVTIQGILFIPHDEQALAYIQVYEHIGNHDKRIMFEFSENEKRMLTTASHSKLTKEWRRKKYVFRLVEKFTVKGKLIYQDDYYFLKPDYFVHKTPLFNHYVMANKIPFDVSDLKEMEGLDGTVGDEQQVYNVHGYLFGNDILNLFYVIGESAHPKQPEYENPLKRPLFMDDIFPTSIDDPNILKESLIIEDERFVFFLENAIGAAIGSQFMFYQEIFLRCALSINESQKSKYITNYVQECVILRRGTAIHYFG